MSVKGFDFEINGVKYNAAEDAQGDHYSVSGEPLRPPNAVTVQGEASQKFQMRPDTLLWTHTDWSGGEGQQKFNAQVPNRYRELTAVRAFERPGTLTPGYYIEDTQDSSGSSDLAKDGILVIGGGSLYLLDFDTNDSYKWDDINKKWAAAVSLSGVTNGSVYRSAGDFDRIYWQETGTQNIWSWDGSGSPATISTATVDASNTFLAALGAYVYGFSPNQGKTWEIQKSGGTTLIDDHSDEQGANKKSQITELDGRIYTMTSQTDRTMVREITPSSAAGTGFGNEIARMPGFEAESIWAHSGLLYLSGQADGHAVIMYLIPGGTYGTLGKVRAYDKVGETAGLQGGAKMLEHFFVSNELSASENTVGLWEVDAVSGGFALLGFDEDGDAASADVRSLVVFNDQIFFSRQKNASTRRVNRAYSSGYSQNSEAISPWHDFDLADEKILASLVLSTEALPADWTVAVSYAIDGSASFTAGISYTTTNGKGTKVAISTDSSTKKFRTLSIKISFTYTGGGVPSSAPVLLGVDVLAMIAKPTKVWRILLDLSDDKSGGGHSGARKITNIQAAAATESVIDFKDGYTKRDPGSFESNDVVIDSYSIVLSHPGEGVGAVVLKELA